jgi:GST-like protein
MGTNAPAMKRGRMVNRPSGEPSSQLCERHEASDFEIKTADKLAKAAAEWRAQLSRVS